MNLEQTLEKIVEHAHEELRIVRKRAEQKTAARDHGKDYHEAQTAADRLDHYAHLVRRLHDAEYKDGWRHESLNEESPGIARVVRLPRNLDPILPAHEDRVPAHWGRSRTTSAGLLSSRSPRKRGWRSRASLVHSANPI